MVQARPRRFAFHEEQVIDSIVNDWLEKGFSRPSSSEYSSPVTLTRRKSGEYRLCVDYRQLNKYTTPLLRQIPHIDNLIARAV